MNHFKLLFLLILINASCVEKKSTKIPYLLKKSDKSVISPSSHDASYVKGIYVTADIQVLKDGTNRFKIPLPGGGDITIVQTKGGISEKGSFYGEVEGQKYSSVLLTYVDDGLYGNITTDSSQYRIMYSGENVYEVAQIDPSQMTEADDDATVPEYGNNADRQAAPPCNDAGSVIDVLVVYTQSAEQGVGGTSKMAALIGQCKTQTNLCYQKSGISQRINIVHSAKINYTESGNSLTDRDALQKGSGALAQAHTLRNTYKADIVVLIVETAEGDNCGKAFIMDPVGAAHANYAFAVVKRMCAVDNKTFAHELGHIMGARHQSTIDNAATPYPYAHGWQVLAPAATPIRPWRTVMSKTANTTRIEYFSNPDISYPEAAPNNPTGTASANNAKVLNNTAGTVAKFKCSQ